MRKKEREKRGIHTHSIHRCWYPSKYQVWNLETWWSKRTCSHTHTVKRRERATQTAGRAWNRWITRYLVTVAPVTPSSSKHIHTRAHISFMKNRLLCLTVLFDSPPVFSWDKRMDHMHADCCFIRTRPIVICMQLVYLRLSSLIHLSIFRSYWSWKVQKC